MDPKILLALWLYATLEGVGSARALGRLCEAHEAYRWICGGVSVDYHTLADFRVAHVESLDELLTQSVATLMAAGAVALERVAQDGMRVRASAGAAWFRRKKTLKRCLREARAQVEVLRRELEADPGATERRQPPGRTVRDRCPAASPPAAESAAIPPFSDPPPRPIRSTSACPVLLDHHPIHSQALRRAPSALPSAPP